MKLHAFLISVVVIIMLVSALLHILNHSDNFLFLFLGIVLSILFVFVFIIFFIGFCKVYPQEKVQIIGEASTEDGSIVYYFTYGDGTTSCVNVKECRVETNSDEPGLYVKKRKLLFIYANSNVLKLPKEEEEKEYDRN